MPVVELNYSRLRRLVGGNLSKKTITDVLPYLGLDIEGHTDTTIRVEYSPNRPDYSTEYSIALGLQGLLGRKTGMAKIHIKKNKTYQIHAEKSVSKVRPYVTALVAQNGKIDDHTLKQLVSMQEDLHMGLGRGRTKSAIGLHDLDNVAFPLRYTTTGRGHSFTPLGSDSERTIHDILSGMKVGREYGHILGRSGKVPLIVDAQNRTVSLPPVINAASTAMTTKTRAILVEVTGTDKGHIEDVLSVVALTLHGAGFELYEVVVSGAGNSTPRLMPRKMKVKAGLAGATLGLDLTAGKMATILRKSRLDAAARGRMVECTIPRYRFDILGEMDVIEEILLGYGVANMAPVLSPSTTLGQRHHTSVTHRSVRSVMTGLGYAEALNPCLTGRRVLYEDTGKSASGQIAVLNSKSAEHTVLRDSLLPGLIADFSRNVHESYPQRLFEIGIVFGRHPSLTEKIHLCAASSHGETNFAEIKSVLQRVVSLTFGIQCSTQASENPLFEEGRCADVIADGKVIGVAGELSKSVMGRLRLREPLAAFELRLAD